MGTAQQQRLTPVVGPSVWTAAELHADRSWVHQLTGIERTKLHDATLHRSARGHQTRQAAREAFSLPALAESFRQLHDQVNTGRGLFLLSGLNVRDYSLDQLVTLCAGLAILLDRALVPQNIAGDLVSFVTNHGEAQLNEHQVRGHRGSAQMLPHSDSAELVGLLCVRSAQQGGATLLCSSAAVRNEILRSNAAHLVPLQKGFYFDLTGKTESGVSQRRLPVYGHQAACRFNKIRIEAGMRKVGVPLSPAEAAALKYMSDLVRRPDLAIRLYLEPGDILFLNNSSVLHGREEYEDWPQPDRKRLLIRFWMNRQKRLRPE